MPSDCARILLFLLLIVPLAHADEAADKALLSIERIFVQGEFDGAHFSGRWLEGEAAYAVLEPAESGGGRDLLRFDAETGERKVIAPAAWLAPGRDARPLGIDGWSLSRQRDKLLVFANAQRVWRQNTRGDYWVLDLTSRELRQLGGQSAPPQSLQFAKFSPDGGRAAYVRANNIYVEDLRDGAVAQITEDGGEQLINGTFDWVYEEELFLRDGCRWSPDGARLAYWQLDTSGMKEYPLVELTAGLYPKLRRFAYPKTGELNAACRVGVVSAAGAGGPDSGETGWIELPGDPRQHYIARMEWTPKGEILLQQLNRRQDALRIFIAGAAGGEAREVLVERDAAWIDVHDELRWLERAGGFTWASERDGWRHLWGIWPSGEPQLLTRGAFDAVELLAVDEKSDALYFSASPENPTQSYLYRSSLASGEPQRLTPLDQSGAHRYTISSDGRYAFHSRSRFGEPPLTELIRLPSHQTLRVLADDAPLREKLKALKLPAGELFRVEIEAGAGQRLPIDAWAMKPPDFDPAKKYPVLVHVYGEPAGQTVVDAWGGRGWLWHAMLAQRGYVVMSFENRGTPAPRGRAWRKSVHRQIGILASADQAAALRAAMAERPWMDPARIGVWGWSGGGSSTLQLLFRYPELYKAGMAIAFIANQRYYDTIYQERYMGLPEDNPEGYREGSPLTHAHKLEGPLLLVYGTGDDNCHYQNCEALIDELVAHGKRFDMMAYPNRSHGIHEGRGTTRHLYELLTRWLEEHLPAGGRS